MTAWHGPAGGVTVPSGRDRAMRQAREPESGPDVYLGATREDLLATFVSVVAWRPE